jgi:hypothetical protein
VDTQKINFIFGLIDRQTMIDEPCNFFFVWHDVIFATPAQAGIAEFIVGEVDAAAGGDALALPR